MSDKILLGTCIPDYRLKFFNCININTSNLLVVSGRSYHAKTVKYKKPFTGVYEVKNLFFFNRHLLIQILPFKKFFSATTVIMEFNLKNLSFYLVFFMRLIFNKPTFLWGHAWSKKGKGSKSEFIRLFFKKRCSGYIAYTDSQKKELEAQVPNQKIFAACNAIYDANEMTPKIIESQHINKFIYVGRLVSSKKPILLLRAFHTSIKNLPKDIELIIVGEGNEYKRLDNYILDNKLTGRVKLLGHVSNYNTLRDVYSKSIASLSPGAAGLSITQSLGFGVPIIISKNEAHGPEIEASRSNINSEFFETDNINDLSSKIISFTKNKMFWIGNRESISEFCRENYSIERMAAPFLKVFNTP